MPAKIFIQYAEHHHHCVIVVIVCNHLHPMANERPKKKKEEGKWRLAVRRAGRGRATLDPVRWYFCNKCVAELLRIDISVNLMSSRVREQQTPTHKILNFIYPMFTALLYLSRVSQLHACELPIHSSPKYDFGHSPKQLQLPFFSFFFFRSHRKRPLCIRFWYLLFSVVHTIADANVRVLYCQHSDASHRCHGPHTHTHCCLIRYSKIRFSILTGMKLI